MGNKNADGLTIGARSVPDMYWKGYVNSFVVCDPSHSTAQRQAMEALINAYWAIY